VELTKLGVEINEEKSGTVGLSKKERVSHSGALNIILTRKWV